MTDAWDDDDRAIARALGADAPDDGVAPDPGAVAGYEAVLSHLPFSEVAPPADLEDRVVAAALARRTATARAIDPATTRGRSARARMSRRWVAAGVAAVAAAAVAVVLVAGRPGSGPGSFGARIEPAAANGDLSRVLSEAGTRQSVLRTPAGAESGRAILDPKGQGYLTGLRLPAPVGVSEWLWLDTAGGPVRVGPIPTASVVHFVVRGAPSSVLGVIVAPAPASQTPSSPGRASLRATFAAP